MSTLITSTQGSSSSSGESVRIALTPTAGFCIKSVTTNAGFYTYSGPPRPPAVSGSEESVTPKPSNLLEPTTGLLPPNGHTFQIPKDVKVFLNIAWDKRVPAPPKADEEVVRRAMAGADLDDEEIGAYFVPVVVSEPREDKDKTGKPSVVFDCVFSASLKSRCTKDREFRMYLIELALEHVEEKAHITLSRQVGTPNIASKGKLEARTVLMPRALLDPVWASKAPRTPLVQELPGGPSSPMQEQDNAASSGPGLPMAKPKSILKTATPVVGTGAGGRKPLIEEVESAMKDDTTSGSGPDFSLNAYVKKLSELPPLRWRWEKEGERLKIEVDVPGLTPELHAESTLDIEARRVLLHIPRKHFLDINLELSDAQIGKLGEAPPPEDDTKDAPLSEIMNMDLLSLRLRGLNAGEALRLKRQRDFDIDNARAEWRVGENKLMISV